MAANTTLSSPYWLAVAVLAGTLAGCHSGPFAPKERTSIVTPHTRIAAIEETASKADGSQSEEQIDLTNRLAQQIQSESDPVVRRSIQRAIGEFRTPMARSVLLAGLQDTDPKVRITCCAKLGERGESMAVPALARVLQSDEEFDVRIAAVDALGLIDSPAAVQALGKALADRDPAMQFAGIQALKDSTGESFNGDVESWQQYVNSRTPAASDTVQLAEQPGETNRF
ncbi:MAG: HEAT repeat domain-containing protein [Planctomycetota bacterium]